MPVKIILGAQDRTIDARRAADRARRLLPNASVDLLPGTGHLIIDQAARIQAALGPPPGPRVRV